MSEATIILPAVDDSKVSADLRELTQELCERGHERGGGFLGGEFGYGTEFENEVFEMFPFFWGDCECGFSDEWNEAGREWDWLKANPHAEECYQSEIRRRGFTDYADFSDVDHELREATNRSVTEQVCAEMGLDPSFGTHVHCTCGRQERYAAWRKTPDGNHDPRCGIERPNFRHKESGFEVRWYKCIGRGMEFSRKIDRKKWRQIYNECLESLK